MTTIDQIYENAEDLAYLADRDGFEKVVDELDYTVIEVPKGSVNKRAQFILSRVS